MHSLAPPSDTVQKPVPGQQSGTFWLENCQGLSQSLFDVGCMEISPPNFLNGGSNSSHDGSGFYCHFGKMFFFCRFFEEFLWLYGIF
jgi:hypothetical protein